MTIAACSTRAATARLLDAVRQDRQWRGRGAWAEVRAAPRRSSPRREKAPTAAERDREWLEHAAKEIAALAPEPGEETSLAEQRASMQAGAKAGEALTGLDELLGGSEGALAQLRAAARRIERGRRRPCAAGRGAGQPRSRGDRGQRGRGADRTRRRGAGVRSGRLEAVEARLFDIRGAGAQASGRGRRAGGAGRGAAGQARR